MPGPTELAIILVIVLILFGAGRLPQVFEALGDGMRRFREAQKEGEDEPVLDTKPKPAPPKEIREDRPAPAAAPKEPVEAEQVTDDEARG